MPKQFCSYRDRADDFTVPLLADVEQTVGKAYSVSGKRAVIIIDEQAWCAIATITGWVGLSVGGRSQGGIGIAVRISCLKDASARWLSVKG
ncbi:MAG TPA: hypothetical protein VGN25_00200 [Solirubrobacteraceae bacterium]|jgi:hypothetical protein|nr:hypothetical protein [Solirubrobacteraceae bacterium]